MVAAFVAAFAIGKATAGTDESQSEAKSVEVRSGSTDVPKLESVGAVPALRLAPQSTTTSDTVSPSDSSSVGATSPSDSSSSPAPSPATPTPTPTPAPDGGGFGGEG